MSLVLCENDTNGTMPFFAKIGIVPFYTVRGGVISAFALKKNCTKHARCKDKVQRRDKATYFTSLGVYIFGGF